MQFRLGSHSLPVEQGRFVRPSLPAISVGTTFATLRLLAMSFISNCPRVRAIRAQYSNLFQDAEGSMRLFMWHKDQRAVSHCLTAILQNGPDMNTDPSS